MLRQLNCNHRISHAKSQLQVSSCVFQIYKYYRSKLKGLDWLALISCRLRLANYFQMFIKKLLNILSSAYTYISGKLNILFHTYNLSCFQEFQQLLCDWHIVCLKHIFSNKTTELFFLHKKLFVCVFVPLMLSLPNHSEKCSQVCKCYHHNNNSN